MNLANLLARAQRLYPNQTALFTGNQPVATFAELHSKVAALAGSLRRQLGLETGDRVALVMKNAVEFVEVLLASWHAGLVVVPVNPRLHPREIAYILGHSKTRVCFATASLAEDIKELPGELDELDALISVSSEDYARLVAGDPVAIVERRPEDLAWLFYTSGTTGRPKGAMLSHRNLLTMTTGYFVDFDAVSSNDALLHIGPMCHGSGLYILPYLAAGAAQVLPSSRSMDPDEIFDLIESHPGASFYAAPTIVQRLVSSDRARTADTTNLKLIVYGGAPMYCADLKRALGCFGPKMAQVYGQGESPMAIAVLPKSAHNSGPDEKRLRSVGLAQSVVDVRVADDEGSTVAPGQLGEVLVRGDTVMSGYWRNEEASAKALRDGWLYTGDIGWMDNAGFITLQDRSKDVIISGGTNIYPREVEEVLLTHPAVVEASVVGRPDPEWGESVVAFVVLHPDQTASSKELDSFCLNSIARYKRPKEYKFVGQLPKSHIGKILKKDLREQLQREAIVATKTAGA